MNNIEKNLRIVSGCAAIVLSLVSNVLPGLAQTSVGIPPLIVQHPQPLMGFEFGVGQNSQSGTMMCNCGSTFNNGKGTGWSGSVFFQLPVGNDFNVGMKAGYDRENTSTTTAENEVAVVESADSNQAVNLSDSRIASVNISFLQFDPFIQYQVLHSDFFVQLGAGVSVPLSSNLTQTRQLPSNSPYTFPTGTNSETIESGSFGGITTPQFSGLLSAGYNFHVGAIVFAPAVAYNYPFSTNNSVNGNNWKISTIAGSVALKFNP